MQNPSEQLETVLHKVNRLIRQYKVLEKENERIRQELEKKSEAESLLKEKAVQLEQQLNLIRASGGEGDETSRKELEKQLNHYIREIDRCISILGQ